VDGTKGGQESERSGAARSVVLVDGDDNALGVEAALACHLLPGRKHRAFAAIVLERDGRVVIARRAASKMLWHGTWDATVASHPRPGEGYAEAGERRVREELGVDCALSVLGRFDYRVAFGDVGAENEVCAALVGRLPDGARVAPDPAEVDRVRSIEPGELVRALVERPADWCPWLYLALLCAGRPSAGLPAELDAPLAPWRTGDARRQLRAGLEAHFASGAWRLLDAGDDAA
jgi:isopentenyl-diphosphate delta-isomerase